MGPNGCEAAVQLATRIHIIHMLGAKTLLGAPGIATRNQNQDATRSSWHRTRNKDATRGSWPYY